MKDGDTFGRTPCTRFSGWFFVGNMARFVTTLPFLLARLVVYAPRKPFGRFGSYLGLVDDYHAADGILEHEGEYGYEEHDFVHDEYECATISTSSSSVTDWRRPEPARPLYARNALANLISERPSALSGGLAIRAVCDTQITRARVARARSVPSGISATNKRKNDDNG